MRTLILALALAAAPAFAQHPAGAVEIPAGAYAIDPAHSQVLFTVTHLGVSLYTGQFTQPSGTATLNPGHHDQDRLDVSFPIAKVSTTVPALDKHLQSADFFDAARYPDGHFVSTSVTTNPAVRGHATIIGNLTLKGVTKPVTLDAQFVGAAINPLSKRLNVGFTATTTIKRSDFGVSFGVPMVSDEVKLTINAAFEPKGG